MDSKEIRFSGLIRLAPEQVGRWYLVPDLEPTTATGAGTVAAAAGAGSEVEPWC